MINFIIRLLKWLPPVGLALLAAGFFMAIRAKEFTDLAATLSIAGLVLFLLIFVRGESGNVKFYVNVAVASILSLGILVILYLMVSARAVSWDVTKEQRNSLAPQTVSIVKSLESPVKIIGFFNEATQPQAEMVQTFLSRYTKLGGDVSVEMVDPVRDNVKVKQYAAQFETEVYPMDIFVVNEATAKKEPAATQPQGDAAPLASEKIRFKRVTLPQAQMQDPLQNAESPVTNAIVEVTQEKQVRVCVLQGQGYKTLDYSAMDKSQSLSELKKNLADQAIQIEPLQLRGAVPENCTILMAAGVHNDLFPAEMDAIAKYLDGGGKMLVYFDPPGRQSQKLTNWAKLLERYGIRPSESYVLDAMGASAMGDPTVFITNEVDMSHPITKDLAQQRMAFQGVRALEKVDPAPPGLTVTDLVKSSPQSWSETYDNLIATSGRLVMPSPDKRSALPLAVAVSRGEGDGGMKIVAFGNAEMVSDNGISPQSFTLTTLAINWMAGNEERLAIPPRQIEDTPLFVKESQMSMVFVLAVLALPAALFFGGLSYTMLRRRSR